MKTMIFCHANKDVNDAADEIVAIVMTQHKYRSLIGSFLGIVVGIRGITLWCVRVIVVARIARLALIQS